jgi:hypothetical protein
LNVFAKRCPMSFSVTFADGALYAVCESPLSTLSATGETGLDIFFRKFGRFAKLVVALLFTLFGLIVIMDGRRMMIPSGVLEASGSDARNSSSNKGLSG